MNLCKDENIIKSWEYGSIKKGKGINKETFDCSLTVTNKRIINEVKSEYLYTVDECPLNSVHGLNASFFFKTKYVITYYCLLCFID